MLQLDEHLEFQKRAWRIERVGWGILGTLLVLAALGAAGDGPLSEATVRDATSGIVLRYSRFARVTSATVVDLTVPAVPADTVELWIGGDYLRGVTVRWVQPRPVEERAVMDGALFVFAAQRGAPLTIALETYPWRTGARAGALRIADGPTLRFRQLVFP